MTMYRDLQKLDRQPFQDTIDTAFFFPGAGRRDVVDEIKTAISQSVPLLLVTADEGSGKTMVCRMVEEELPPGIISVFLPQAINSFDDMAIVVRQEIGLDLEEDGEETGTAGLLEKIVGTLREQNCRLVVFFDEAEKIYLATLERLRKLLDQVNEEQILVQFVFAGRKLLEENLDQLSIVTFKDIEERRYTLKPLNEQEAHAYLNHCMKIASGEDDEFFSQDLVSKVSERGTFFRRLNLFAAESIQSEQLDTSFLGLIDTIEIDPDSEPEKITDEQKPSAFAGSREVNLEFLSFRKILPGWILFGGGAFLSVLLLFFLFDFSGDSEQPEDGTSEVPIIELKKVVPVNPTPSQEIAEVKEETVESSEPKDGEAALNVTETEDERPSGQQIEELTDAGDKEASPEPVTDGEQPSGQKPEELKQAGNIEIAPDPVEPADIVPSQVGPVVSTGTASSEVVIEPQTPAEEEPVQQKSKEIETKIPSDSSNAPTSEKPVIVNKGDETVEKEDTEVTTNVMVEPLEETEAPFSPGAIKETKLPDQPRLPETIVVIGDEKKFKDSKEVREKTVIEKVEPEVRRADLSDKDVDALFLRRIAAGARWLVGGGSGKYTIQLMVLTSDQAEESLKKMLRTADYQSIANQLYVLRRTGPDPTVMAFYGEYPSLAAARSGRNNLPVFLRKHNPYAISVFGAVEKATAPQ